MKENTPLRELIKLLDISIKDCEWQLNIFKENKMDSSAITTEAMMFAYKISKEKAESLLEKERQAIVDAFDAGGINRLQDSNDYFTNKYNTND